MMKKLVKTAFFVYLLAGIAVAEAATIPPGNPFYAVQNGVRSLRRAFTFNPTGKALLEARLMNERLLDVETVTRLNPDPAAQELAGTAYTDEADVFAASAKGIGDERVFDAVLEIALGHSARFSGVPEHEALFMKMVRLPRVVWGVEAGGIIRARFMKAISGMPDGLKEVRGLELLNALELESPAPEFVKDIERVKDDVAVALAARVKRGDGMLEAASAAPARATLRFMALEEARVRSVDLEARNSLTRARERVLAEAAASRAIHASSVREALLYVKELAAEAGVRPEQAAYFTEQAAKFLSENAYGIAFPHAVSAGMAVNNAVLLANITKKDLREDVTIVKKQYDALTVKPQGVEKRIAAVADAINRVPAAETLAALRDIKLTLSF